MPELFSGRTSFNPDGLTRRHFYVAIKGATAMSNPPKYFERAFLKAASVILRIGQDRVLKSWQATSCVAFVIKNSNFVWKKVPVQVSINVKTDQIDRALISAWLCCIIRFDYKR